jgi:AcrR family transcriptional regulator
MYAYTERDDTRTRSTRAQEAADARDDRRVARELFAERGYHDTTLPEIAEAADVSTRTIFAYFPSKEDILFSDFPLMREALAQALAERPEGEDALETVRKFILSLHEYKRDDLDEKMRLCIESDETLRSHLRARLASLEELIARRSPRTSMQPTTISVHRSSRPRSRGVQRLDRARRRPAGKPKTEDDVAAQIDPIITFLRGGLDALRRLAQPADAEAPGGLHTFPPSVAEERLFQRGTTLVRRLSLAPGEAMHWHRDPFSSGNRGHCGAMPSGLNTATARESERFEVSPGQAGWDEPTDRLHRGVNVGEQPYEEITVFFLDHPDAVPQPGDTE